VQSDSSSDPVRATDEPAPNAVPREKETRRGRRRVLDDAKRREICAYVAGGCNVREAARFVRCNINTVRREAERNPEFDEQLRRAQTYAQLSPLRAMQLASATHWRAAAWMLERAFPNRFAKPNPGAFGSRQARELMNEVLSVVSSETSDPHKYERIEKRLRGAFEYYIRAACDQRRTTRGFRQAMKFFDDKNITPQPLSEFGITIPDFDTLMSAASTPPAVGPARQTSSSPASRPPRTPAESFWSDALETLRESLSKPHPAEPAGARVTAPQNLKIQPTSDVPN
jgi:hypothetical protein